MSFTIAGKPVGQIGIGMMGFLWPGKEKPTDEAVETLKVALELGANFWNAGPHYGTPERNSLHLLNAYFTKYPGDADRVVISVKGCFDFAKGATTDAAGVKTSIEQCLAILEGKCRIDVFEPARLNPDIPVEETVGAIAEFVKVGKIGGVGLSECSASSIRKASAVTSIAAVEVELSLFATDILSNGVADACKEHEVAIVAYSPLSRGFLTGQLRKYEDLPENDLRKMYPRYQKDSFDENIKLVEEIEKVAAKKGCTIIEAAIAWVSAQSAVVGTPVIPIPSASSIPHAEENLKRVQLTDEELREINKVLARTEVKGSRIPPRFAHMMEVWRMRLFGY